MRVARLGLGGHGPLKQVESQDRGSPPSPPPPPASLALVPRGGALCALQQSGGVWGERRSSSGPLAGGDGGTSFCCQFVVLQRWLTETQQAGGHWGLREGSLSPVNTSSDRELLRCRLLYSRWLLKTGKACSHCEGLKLVLWRSRRCSDTCVPGGVVRAPERCGEQVRNTGPRPEGRAGVSCLQH